MNAQIQEFWNLNRMYTPLRDELMALLSDDDLAFTPGGSNPTLGELCRELGEIGVCLCAILQDLQDRLQLPQQ